MRAPLMLLSLVLLVGVLAGPAAAQEPLPGSAQAGAASQPRVPPVAGCIPRSPAGATPVVSS